MSTPNLPPAPAPRAILETALYVDDLDSATEFYQGLLGLKAFQTVPGRHVFFRIGQAVLLVFHPDETNKPSQNARLPVPPHGARGPGHVCFAMPRAQINAMRARLLASGIAIDAEFDWPNGAHSLYVRDPAGNSVEFAEPGLWE